MTHNKDKSCDSQYVAAGMHESHNVHICVCTSKREYRLHMFLTLYVGRGFTMSTYSLNNTLSADK